MRRSSLLSHASRSIFIPPSPASHGRLSAAPTLRGARNTLTCIQIQRHYLSQQRRHFADDKRSPTPSSDSSEPISRGAPPSVSQESQPNPSPSSPDHPEPPAAVDSNNQGAGSEVPKAFAFSNHGGNGELPSATELRRSRISKRLTNIMDNLQGNIFLASQHLNDLTGYSGIEALKRTITSHEQHLQTSQEAVRVARQNYKQLVADRSASQREVTALLARKDTWTPIDLERFTSLYRSDHGNEHAVQEAQQQLADSERNAEQAASRLNAAILARYHEEQIWSDKIRRMSTWGTWGLMGVNVLLFLVFQFGFEPWRRERLTKGFEDKVLAALEKEREVTRVEAGMADFDVAGPAAAETTDKKTDEELTSAANVAGLDAQKMDAETNTELISAADTPEVADGTLATTTEEVAQTTDLPAETEANKASLLLLREAKPWRESLVEPCLAQIQKLFSEEKITLRRQDVTLVALEGLATGAAVAGLVVMYILRPN